MFVFDVSDFKFVGKVKPACFIANEEVVTIAIGEVSNICIGLDLFDVTFSPIVGILLTC